MCALWQVLLPYHSWDRATRREPHNATDGATLFALGAATGADGIFTDVSSGEATLVVVLLSLFLRRVLY